MKQSLLCLLLICGTLAPARAGLIQTNINPALLYYQAFIIGPELSKADEDYLLTNEWSGQQLPGRVGELMKQQDAKFGFVRKAAVSRETCDWGIDWSAGPGTLLPQLFRVKKTAQMARLRASWELQNDRPAEATDDLVAAFVMARNASRDHSMIGALVQFACEAIVCGTVAENYGRISSRDLEKFVSGMSNAPARGTVADAIDVAERNCFPGWIQAQIPEWRREHPGDDARIMSLLRGTIEASFDSGTPRTNPWPAIVQASGGTSEGFLRLVRDLDPWFVRLAAIERLPQVDYDSQTAQFVRDMEATTNPLVREFFPALTRIRPRELGVQIQEAMVRAAAEFKKSGLEGFNRVMDPGGHGPFHYERFVFDGADRGFQLKSEYAGRGYPEVMIFVEKDGPAFQVSGKNAGKASP